MANDLIDGDGVHDCGGSRCADPFDIIAFEIVPWAFRKNRPQHLAEAFARAGHRVFYIEPWDFVPATDGGASYTVERQGERIFTVRLALKEPPTFPFEIPVAGTSDAAVRALDTLAHDFQVDAAVSFVGLATWLPVVTALRGRHGWPIVYDCMDEYEDFPGIGKILPVAERQLVREAHLVSATSEYLHAKFEGTAQTAILVRNAAPAGFGDACRDEGRLGLVPRPILGFVGGIESWINVDLLAALATARPDASLVLVGLVNTDVLPLRRLSNVFFVGERPHAALPGYLHEFDACLIPFRDDPVARAADPTKTYEYLASGTPVVATPLPELDRFGDLIYRAGDAAGFAAAVDAALNEPAARQVARREAMAGETWDHRAEFLLASMAPLVGSRPLVGARP